MAIAEIFSVSLLGLVGYMYNQNKNSEVSYLKSSIDNRDYLVQNFPDRQVAADTLAKISNLSPISCWTCHSGYKKPQLVRPK